VSGKFEFAVQESPEQMTIKLQGTIDEDVDFSSIPTPKKPRYVFNFDGVKGINSCGIREWVRFSEKIDSSAQMIYVNCTQIIIEQINMVAGFFRAGSKVEKFYAPYFCEDCDEEKKVLIEASQVKDNEAPAVNCDGCKKPMEFDALEEQYFRFLKMTA
jgi:thiol-disulfide isomerase/thioredoxin